MTDCYRIKGSDYELLAYSHPSAGAMVEVSTSLPRMTYGHNVTLLNGVEMHRYAVLRLLQTLRHDIGFEVSNLSVLSVSSIEIAADYQVNDGVGAGCRIIQYHAKRPKRGKIGSICEKGFVYASKGSDRTVTVYEKLGEVRKRQKGLLKGHPEFQDELVGRFRVELKLRPKRLGAKFKPFADLGYVMDHIEDLFALNQEYGAEQIALLAPPSDCGQEIVAVGKGCTAIGMGMLWQAIKSKGYDEAIKGYPTKPDTKKELRDYFRKWGYEPPF